MLLESKDQAAEEGQPGSSQPIPQSAIRLALNDSVSDEEFLSSWLRLLVEEVGGGAVAAVLLKDGADLRCTFSSALSDRDTASLEAVGRRCAAEIKAVIRRFDEGAPQSGRVGIATPILHASELVAVAVILQGDRGRGDALRTLRTVQISSGWLRARLLTRKEALPRAARWRLLRDLSTRLLQQNGLDGATQVLATDLAASFGYERVSVHLREGLNVRLRAVSGAGEFDRRLGVVKKLQAAAEEAILQKAVIHYPDVEGGAFLVTRAHADVVRLQGGTLCTTPILFRGEPLGAIVCESASPEGTPHSVVETLAELAGSLGAILHFFQERNAPLPQRARRWLVTAVSQLFGPAALKLKLATLCLVTLFAGACLLRDEYRITANARVDGQELATLAAPFDGFILAEFGRPGTVIAGGAVLAKLDDRDMRLERLRQAATRRQKTAELDRATAENRLSDANVIEAQIAQTDAELAYLDAMIGRAEIKSPYRGLIISGDLSQAVGTPVKRGDPLFQVAQADSFRITLDVNEDLVDRTRAGQTGDLLLASLPDATFPITVTTITPITEAKEGQAVFRVEARLTRSDPRLRHGMEGIARLSAGQQRLIWIWSHRLVGWLKLKAWPYLPWSGSAHGD
ncbi:efflux RND transporter periplasmic adaptor subunit [Methylobacterium durans]|uniref:GAF domain-containing protein n=1 Tax=Methylobacterium durans TaxID=2202825 RepID=A0A2U8W6Q4_9HYPH|nr:efflux RND transporter periplasmic adaptor subunit [Methylobacterium durans]AWN41765.1 hypothetical protein DK389_16220 [Methylobacterium durans]